jgi:hypothetical protein
MYVDQLQAELLQVSEEQLLRSLIAIKLDAKYASRRCGRFKHPYDLTRSQLDDPCLTRVHRFRFQQYVAEPFVQFRTCLSGQFADVTDRESRGIKVDADLAGAGILPIEKMCGFNPFFCFQQVSKSLNASVRGIGHRWQ